MDTKAKTGWYIFLYHNISWEENPFMRATFSTLPPDIFRDHLTHLSKIGEFVSVPGGLDRLNRGRLTHPLFSFWFDDALAGVQRYALPMLEKFNVTAAVSACSRFWERSELFWMYKLSYLNYIDGLKFLRTRLKKYGYESWMFVENFIMANFKESVIKEIDAVFNELCSKDEQKYAFRLLEAADSLSALKKKGWVIANHTAAHYPVGEDNLLKYFKGQFAECEARYNRLFKENSKFWVLPFDVIGRNLPFGQPEYYPKNIIKAFNKCGGSRYLVFVGDRPNEKANINKKVIFRINAPAYSGRELAWLIK